MRASGTGYPPTLTSVNRERARACTGNCALDCDLNRDLNRDLNSSLLNGPVYPYLTVQPHGIDTATSTVWIYVPQANHARHRRQDRQ
ncbi:hypothetical protein INS49_011084 [Diaporthe citri]|uniref:uncharacterized protein n=1 Tax=Diaporthe citri TaxID=83186 RepID=UPI001C810FD8|nr:uncharacterized protein INS49_011084 [Diaporthe citri]KAG6360028.1 hypothetical protein INS49_011084 [Diaporthe citri]